MLTSFCNSIYAATATIMNRRSLLLGSLCLIALSTVGCEPSPMPVSDVDKATALITKTFEAWKAGESLDAQRERSEPVYVADEQWLNGAQLKEYTLSGPGEVFGTNIRFKVKLKMIDNKGAEKEREAKYLVSTTPANTIAREDR